MKPVRREAFVSFEDEVRRLRELAHRSPPRLWAGSLHFFAELKHWLASSPAESKPELGPAIVYPDPSLNLSFPYVEDELALALALRWGQYPETKQIKALAEQFAISEELFQRPVTALSGGERMVLSICKAVTLAEKSHSLCVCSPFFWLDHQRRDLVNINLEKCANSGVDTWLLLLEGEEGETIEPHKSLLSPWGLEPTLTWGLDLENAEVLFPETKFPREIPEKAIIFNREGKLTDLRSPTLISGDNGVGKSTLARLLAGILNPQKGRIQAVANGYSGRARLLLQDVPLHLFGHSINKHLERVFNFDKERKKKALELFASLQSQCARELARLSSTATIGTKEETEITTIFQTKLGLIAERLATQPPVLILDEPGWCLSRPLAQAFVKVVVQAAHERKVAVAIISHQTSWWAGFAMDRIALTPDTPRNAVVVRRVN